MDHNVSKVATALHWLSEAALIGGFDHDTQTTSLIRRPPGRLPEPPSMTDGFTKQLGGRPRSPAVGTQLDLRHLGLTRPCCLVNAIVLAFGDDFEPRRPGDLGLDPALGQWNEAWDAVVAVEIGNHRCPPKKLPPPEGCLRPSFHRHQGSEPASSRGRSITRSGQTRECEIRHFTLSPAGRIERNGPRALYIRKSRSGESLGRGRSTGSELSEFLAYKVLWSTERRRCGWGRNELEPVSHRAMGRIVSMRVPNHRIGLSVSRNAVRLARARGEHAPRVAGSGTIGASLGAVSRRRLPDCVPGPDCSETGHAR